MPYEFYNPSPTGARIGDCVIRAICKALNQTWEHTYVALCVQGFSMCDLPNADSVWGEYAGTQDITVNNASLVFDYAGVTRLR